MADAKQGKSPIEDFFNGLAPSRSVLAKPKLGGFSSSSFASSSNKGSCNPFGSILRPSQLKTGANPFLKVTDAFVTDTESKEQKEDTPTDDRLKEKEAQEADAPKFVPLGSTNVTRISNVPTAVQPAPSSSAGFVFGQNLSARVELKESVNNGEASSTENTTSDKSTELLFSNAAATVKENQEEVSPSPSELRRNREGLAAAAAEYERSHARPPPATTNVTITGEEGEINVLQISCRLFAWEAGSWRERGRGVLRLNDAESAAGGEGEGGARLVARVSGSLRVVLNTKLWPDMVVERAGTKSLRITAADALQQVKLFLIMASPGDIAQLHRALTTRISVSKRTTSVSSNSGTQNATSQKAAERLEADVDESEYLEKNDDNKNDDKQEAVDSAVDDDVPDNDDVPDSELANDRLQTDNTHKTDQHESNVDMKEDNEAKALKRKEPVEDETTPKRQCPEILIE